MPRPHNRILVPPRASFQNFRRARPSFLHGSLPPRDGSRSNDIDFTCVKPPSLPINPVYHFAPWLKHCTSTLICILGLHGQCAKESSWVLCVNCYTFLVHWSTRHVMLLGAEIIIPDCWQKKMVLPSPVRMIEYPDTAASAKRSSSSSLVSLKKQYK